MTPKRPLERPGPDVRARLLAAAGRTPSTRPGAWRRRVVGSALFAVAWTLVTGAGLRARADWAELSWGSLTQTFGVLLLVAGVAAAVALTRGRAMAGAAIETLAAVVVMGLVVLVALVLTVDPHGASTRIFAGAAMGWHLVPCDLMVIGLGLPLLIAGLVPLAGLTLGRPGLTGGAVGFAAATLAHAVVRFHCPVGGAGHALLGHLLPGIPLMLIGAWLGRSGVVERGRAKFTRAGEERP